MAAKTKLTSNDFKTGMSIILSGAPYRVLEFMHVKPGKGAAFVRSKLKNYLTGSTVDHTWRAGEGVEMAQMEKRETQLSYVDGNDYVFMDMKTYEEIRLEKDPHWCKYLTEGCPATVLFWNSKVISVDPPATVELHVASTSPGVKGNTVSGGSTKPATLESGATIQVPLFIQAGQVIKVDTKTDSYLGKAGGH